MYSFEEPNKKFICMFKFFNSKDYIWMIIYEYEWNGIKWNT